MFFKILFASLLIGLTSCFSNLETKHSAISSNEFNLLWSSIKDKKGMDKAAFSAAIERYNKHDSFSKNLITLVDFNKPSTAKRLYVIDLEKRSIVFNTFVAHGQGTGNNYAKHFSNKEGSHQSSLGLYKTSNTYYGKHGYSLKLKGLDAGINDNALNRAIVIHGADYVSEDFIKKHGRLGRSWGCPAVPKSLAKPIIDKIKNGSCLFIYKNLN